MPQTKDRRVVAWLVTNQPTPLLLNTTITGKGRTMETYQLIINAITTVGFPIVMCLILFWYVNKQNEAHKGEIESLRAVIENNTNSITKLYEKIDALIDLGRG